MFRFCLRELFLAPTASLIIFNFSNSLVSYPDFKNS